MERSARGWKPGDMAWYQDILSSVVTESEEAAGVLGQCPPSAAANLSHRSRALSPVVLVGPPTPACVALFACGVRLAAHDPMLG